MKKLPERSPSPAESASILLGSPSENRNIVYDYMPKEDPPLRFEDLRAHSGSRHERRRTNVQDSLELSDVFDGSFLQKEKEIDLQSDKSDEFEERLMKASKRKMEISIKGTKKGYLEDEEGGETPQLKPVQKRKGSEPEEYESRFRMPSYEDFQEIMKTVDEMKDSEEQKKEEVDIKSIQDTLKSI